jgi:hypothetical protein
LNLKKRIQNKKMKTEIKGKEKRTLPGRVAHQGAQQRSPSGVHEAAQAPAQQATPYLFVQNIEDKFVLILSSRMDASSAS